MELAGKKIKRKVVSMARYASRWFRAFAGKLAHVQLHRILEPVHGIVHAAELNY